MSHLKQERAFHDGLMLYGVNFLNEVKEHCLHRYDFEENENIAFRQAFDTVKRLIAQKIVKIEKLKLEDLLEYGMDESPLLLPIIGEASDDIMRRLSFPAVIPDEEKRRDSLAYTVSTSVSAEDVDEDYDDDFEDMDVADESQEIKKGVISSTKPSIIKRGIKAGGYVNTIHEDEDYQDESMVYPLQNSQLDRSYSDDVDFQDDSKADDEDEIMFIPLKNNQTNLTASDVIRMSQSSIIQPKVSTREPSPEENISSHRRKKADQISINSEKAAQKLAAEKEKSMVHHNISAVQPNKGNSHPPRSSKSQSRKSKSNSWIRDRKWILADKIGFGSFGEVFQGMNVETGVLFACKVLPVAGNSLAVDKLADEIELMRGLSHRNIVAYLGTLVDEEKGNVYIFQEWVPGGSIAHLLKKFGPFREEVVRNYTRQILLGLQYLHDHNIVHRDIKGGNVLIDDVGTVKLADFGASRKFDLDGTQATTTIRGTPYFMAPEVLSENRYGRKGDIWALGCTMIQMLTGHPPWKEYNLSNLVQLHVLLSSWQQGPPPHQTSYILSKECEDCLNYCFLKDEIKRPLAIDLMKCDFLRLSTTQDSDTEDETPDKRVGQYATNIVSYSSSNAESRNSSDREGDDMMDIRERLSRAVSRASLAMNDDISKLDREIANRQEVQSSRHSDDIHGVRHNILTPPRSQRRLENPKLAQSPQHVSAISKNRSSNDRIPQSLNLPGEMPGTSPSPPLNPYSKGATKISREIVAKAASFSAPVSSVSSPEKRDILGNHEMVRPTIDTSHQYQVPHGDIKRADEKGKMYIPQGFSNHRSPSHSMSEAKDSASKHPKNVMSNRIKNPNQSSARDSETLTPLDEEGHDAMDEGPDSGYPQPRDVMKPALKSPSVMHASVIRRDPPSSASSSRGKSSYDPSSKVIQPKEMIQDMKGKERHPSIDAAVHDQGHIPLRSQVSGTVGKQTNSSDIHSDSRVIGRRSSQWTCLRCRGINTLPEYEKYCKHCATVRGVTGNRDVQAALPRHV